MVHQLETETADAGENAGAGRIPAGFCTLTCPVYKWAQLHETILKAYPVDARHEYEQWKLLPPGTARYHGVGGQAKARFYENIKKTKEILKLSLEPPIGSLGLFCHSLGPFWDSLGLLHSINQNGRLVDTVEEPQGVPEWTQ